jgi:hypothetical protein
MLGQTCVNLCRVPALGVSVATVPRGLDEVSSTTLMEASAGGAGCTAPVKGASDPSSSGASTVQECVARGVAERLVTRCQRNSKALLQSATVNKKGSEWTFLSDKILIVNCGLGLGTGVNPKEGAEFLSAAMNSPLLVAGIVQALAKKEIRRQSKKIANVRFPVFSCSFTRTAPVRN